MDFVHRFKTWVDKIFVSFPDQGIGITHAIAAPELALEYEHVVDTIGGLLSSKRKSGTITSRNLNHLRKSLILSHFISGSPYQPYWSVSLIISDGIQRCGHPLAFLSDRNDDWINAIKLVANLVPRLVSQCPSLREELQADYPSWLAAADALGFFEFGQSKWSLENGRLEVPDELLRPLAENMIEQIISIGPLTVALRLNKLVNNSPEDASLTQMNERNCRGNQGWQRAELPIAYLLNLCAKSIHAQVRTVRPDENQLNALLDFAKAFGCLYDVQPFNVSGKYLFHHNNFVDFLRERCLYKTMYKLDKLPHDKVGLLLKDLFNWTDSSDVSVLGWTVDDAADFAQKILDICGKEPLPRVFEKDELVSFANRNSLLLERLLKIFSHGPLAANSNFLLPTDTTDNLWTKPFIKIDQKQYVILNKEISSIAFYEALASEMRRIRATNPPAPVARQNGGPQSGCIKKRNKSPVDQEIGDAFEQFVREELSRHNVQWISGDFSEKKLSGQCDVVVETNLSIIFIEIKKKTLRNEGRKGNELVLFDDLGPSLIHALMQCTKPALILKKSGAIAIRIGKKQHRKVELNNRTIKRVVLSLLDFGSLHDSFNLETFLKIFSAIQLWAIATEDQGKLACFNKRLLQLNKSENDFRNACRERDRMIPAFSNCFFFNISDFCGLLERVDSNESFDKMLFDGSQFSTLLKKR